MTSGRWAFVLTAAVVVSASTSCADGSVRSTTDDGGCAIAADRAPLAGECTLVDWNVIRVSGATVELEYFVNEPGCSLGLDRIEVDETVDAVTLRVVVGYAGDEGAACPTAIGIRSATVELASPLADRALLGCRPAGSFAPAGGYDRPEARTGAQECGSR